MDRQSRTKTVYINSITTLVCQIIQIFLGFVIRKLFIVYLGVNYLGYNSVFSNILQMLNLADMGIGVAITSFLYKPLADGHRERVNALMYIYKRVYEILGFVVLIIGIGVSFFLPILIPDATCSNAYLRLLFYINLAATVSTYYLSYRRTLLIADQNSYVTSVVDTISSFVASFLQLIVLLNFPNYILYLIIAVAKNIVANLIVSFKCDISYGRIKNQRTSIYYKEYKPLVLTYVKDVFISRLGAFIYYSTDNIIISVYKGSLLAGYLSNYTLITAQVSNVINQIIASIQATFGNYISVSEDITSQREMTDNYLMVHYCIGNFCFLCLAFLMQPFVEIVFGKDFVLSFSTTFFLAMNIMLTVLIQLPSQLFMIYKLYHFDKPIILVSASLNIIVSCALVKTMGIDGVLLGTFLTSLLYLFSRFYIISKKVYCISYSHYIGKFVCYFLVSAVSASLVFLTTMNINGSSIRVFIIKTIGVGLVAILLPSACLCASREFSFLVNKILPSKLKKFYSKQVVWAATIIIVLLFTILNDWLLRGQGNNYVADASNKSLPRNETYICETITNYKLFHISIDDFTASFEDLTVNEKKYTSIFENEVFSWMKSLHEDFGVVFTCYVYYENKDFSLSACTRKFKSEFESNSDWLRFGFHTLNSNTVYGKQNQRIADEYQKTMKCLQEIVSSNAIDNVVRLQSFQGSKKQIEELTQIKIEPITGLLTADDCRQSYYLNEEENSWIYSHDILFHNSGVFFISTDLRAEFIESISDKIMELDGDTWNNQRDILEVFTHEWAINDVVKNSIEQICVYCENRDYNSAFYEDIMGLNVE